MELKAWMFGLFLIVSSILLYILEKIRITLFTNSLDNYVSGLIVVVIAGTILIIIDIIIYKHTKK